MDILHTSYNLGGLICRKNFSLVDELDELLKSFEMQIFLLGERYYRSSVDYCSDRAHKPLQTRVNALSFLQCAGIFVLFSFGITVAVFVMIAEFSINCILYNLLERMTRKLL